MSSHRFLQNHQVAAICPRCGESALHRQHKVTQVDELRKRFSLRRPFICGRCGWEGWIDEAFLRYASGTKNVPLSVEAESYAIPELDLDDLDRTAGPSPDMRRDMTDPRAASSVLSNERIVPEGDSGPQGSGVDRVPDIDLDDPAAEKNAQSQDAVAGKNGHGLRQGSPAAGRTNAGPVVADDSIPAFESDEGSPYSQKVTDDFHHHGRHTGRDCPACHGWTLYRSRTQSIGEALQKTFTTARPYRCHSCGWRGWIRGGWS
jgi:predicted RNA-binding Zn-ribbon protein involved in translation (DUF1610 family)